MHLIIYAYTTKIARAVIIILSDSTGDGGDQFPSLSYVEPYWSGTPAEPYSLLIVKNGTEIGKLVLDDKPYHTFGRLPNCDITLEHPSISRYHAILQYRPSGMNVCTCDLQMSLLINTIK